MAGINTASSKLEDSSSSDDDDLERYPQFATAKRRHEEDVVESSSSSSSPEKSDAGDDRHGSAKKPKPANSSMYSNAAMKMMAKMGHQQGEGLGSTIKGRTEPVLPEMRMGKRGLGFTIPGFDPTSDEYKEADEGKYLEPVIEEKADWMKPCAWDIPSAEELRSWIREGPVKEEIEDETHFCDGTILSNVLTCKSAFDKLETGEFLKARTRSNPYELIKNGIFQNRAAMKMANMDKIFDFMFTFPKREDMSYVVGKNDLLYFADICSAPGGFSEYVLWRRQHEMAKGFGFTLRGGPGVNDFKLDDFFQSPVEYFEPHYGVGGVDGDGDIMRSDNILAFQEFVLRSTDGQGVHFVMGDGGFSVAGKENIQEILSKQLVLCQFCMALSILREGGHFLCKIFDIFTPFTVGLFYLLWRSFDSVAMCKPITSRPANSERYVVCKGLREGADVVQQYLFDLNGRLNELKSRGRQQVDIVEVVPLDVLNSSTDFSQYLTESNASLGRAQINALRRLAHYVRNPNLCVPDQAAIRRKCLDEWKVNDKVRAAPQRCPPGDKICDWGLEKEVRAFLESGALSSQLSSVTDLKSSLSNLRDSYCSIACGQRMLLLSFGKSNIFALHQDGRGSWTRDSRLIKLPIPANTLIEVELVEELKGEGKGQRRIPTVYITDAMRVFDKDIRKRHYEDRMRLAKKMVSALHCRSRPDLMAFRVNSAVGASHLPELLDRLTMKRVKGRTQERLAYQLESSDAFVCPVGLAITRHLTEPWSCAFSKSQNRVYYFNPQLKTSVYDFPAEAAADYVSYNESRCVWTWSLDNSRLHHELTHPPSADSSGSALSKSSLLQHVADLKSKM